MKLKFDNADFPATDTVSNRAATIQTASEFQLHGYTGFQRQNRNPQIETPNKQETKAHASSVITWSVLLSNIFLNPLT